MGTTNRLRAIDAARGAFLALMLCTPPVGDPAVHPALYHAPWNGLTVSDLVFPSFLVTSGLSLAFLLREPVERRTVHRLVRRSVLLVAIGLVYNAYGTTGFDLAHLRLTGVLQLIGITGATAATLALATRRGDGRDRPWALAGIVVGLTAAYGTGLALLGDRCDGAVDCSPYGGFDRAVLGRAHLYRGGLVDYDPEGLAIVLAATALVLVGYLAGTHLRERRDGTALVPVGAGLVVVGQVLAVWRPVNKRLFTPSFAATVAGVALLAVAAVWFALDRRGPAPSARVERVRALAAAPLVALGRNAMVVYLSERLLVRTAGWVHVGDVTVEAWLLERMPIGLPDGALLYGPIVLALVLPLALVLHRQRRYLAL